MKKEKKKLNYNIYNRKKVLGTIFLILFSFLFILCFVQLPYLTTIHSYTIGYLFGNYSYFIYLVFIFKSLDLIFNINIHIQKYLKKYFKKINFHFTTINFIILILGIAFISEGIYNWVNISQQQVGIEIWEINFNNWWNNFISSKNVLLPNFKNQGVMIIFLVTLFSFWSGFLVVILVGVALVSYSIFSFLNGSLIEKIKQLIKGKENKKREKQEHLEKIVDLGFEDKNPILNEKETKKMVKEKEIEKFDKTEIFPFDDPFSKNEIENYEIKTKSINVGMEKNDSNNIEPNFLYTNTKANKKDKKIKEYNITKEFIFNNLEKEEEEDNEK
ncbi:MAG: hypothetical protein ACRCRZ_02815 [Metamycoplasmataceae bacterium]